MKDKEWTHEDTLALQNYEGDLEGQGAGEFVWRAADRIIELERYIGICTFDRAMAIQRYNTIENKLVDIATALGMFDHTDPDATIPTTSEFIVKILELSKKVSER